MRAVVFAFLLAIGLSGCLESTFDVNDLISENDLVYLNPSQKKEEFPNNDYRIVGVVPNESAWNIIIEYTGGCERHQFFTYWDGEITNSLSAKASFSLLHNNRDDQCERLVQDTLEIDMNKVFNGQFPADTTFISVTNAFTGQVTEVDPYLASIEQGQDCLHPASLLGTTCNSGFWKNQWFLLTDTIANYEKVWIQPVRGFDLKIPVSGNYEIGLKLLFGFQFSQKTCEDLPDGKIMPAAITCYILAD